MEIRQEPTWFADARMPRYPRLSKDIEADAVVIGGGITGLSAAYFLAKEGKRVVLIEKERLASGATGRTTAIISSIIDTSMPDILTMFGKETGRRIIDGHRHAIDSIENIVESETIDCDFMRTPSYLYASEPSQEKALKKEFEAAGKLGYAVKKIFPDFPLRNFGVLEIADQAKFHPLKYLSELAQAATDAGAEIFEETEAKHISGKGPLEIETEGGAIRAQFSLLATYEPFTKPLSLYFKKAFYRTYMIEASIPTEVFPEASFEDLSNPYTYFRVDAGKAKDRLIIGGEDHRSDLHVSREKSWKALEDKIRNTLGVDYAITRRWPGPILEPIDGIPYIGPFGAHTFVAMGFSGNGMTYGTLSARMFADYVLGRKNAWSDVFDPGRIPGPIDLYIKGRDYVEEFFGGAVRNTFAYRA